MGERQSRFQPRKRRKSDRGRGSEEEKKKKTCESWAITACRVEAGRWGTHRLLDPAQVENLKGRPGLVLDKARSPAPHGGRGALPSAGGSPSDLLFLAGGGRSSVVSPLLD